MTKIEQTLCIVGLFLYIAGVIWLFQLGGVWFMIGCWVGFLTVYLGVRAKTGKWPDPFD